MRREDEFHAFHSFEKLRYVGVYCLMSFPSPFLSNAKIMQKNNKKVGVVICQNAAQFLQPKGIP